MPIWPVSASATPEAAPLSQPAVNRRHQRVGGLVAGARRRETAIGHRHGPHVGEPEQLPARDLPRSAEARHLVAAKKLPAVLAEAVDVRLDVACATVVVKADYFPLRDGLTDEHVHITKYTDGTALGPL